MEHYVLVPHHGSGRGRVCRNGRAVLFCVADSASSATLIGWCRLVGDRPAEAALAELQRLVVTPGVTAVSAFIVDDSGVNALVYGGVPLTVVRAGERQPLANSPGQAPAVTALGDVAAVELDVSSASNDPLVQLEQGVVAADGFSLRHVMIAPPPWSVAPPGAAAAPAEPAKEEPPPEALSAAPPPPPFGPGEEGQQPEGDTPVAPKAEAQAAPQAERKPERPAAPQPSPKVEPKLLSLRDAGDDLPAAQPLPVATEQPHPHPAAAASGPEPSADPAVVRVAGLRCSRDHFNDPRARFCAVCGIAMHQASFILTEDVRPPLGVLVFSDGSYHNLVNSLVFGRDPDDDPRVRSGDAIGVALVDAGNTISRIHAEVRAVEWDVQLVDRGSTNGTFVWVPTSQQWERLALNQPRTLDPGAQVAFGRLTATFESSLRPA